ncbi:hypothetical protein AR687_23395 [Flavobacteriaceae bacterium CRH]|nr:hypothetical protein AR687_23395 [Flavobacteriaceae bacterium CRH]
MRQFTFIIIASLMLFSCKKNDEFVLLKRIVADEGQYIEREEYFDKDEVVKLSSVLIYYGVSIKVVNDSIFIPKKVIRIRIIYGTFKIKVMILYGIQLIF